MRAAGLPVLLTFTSPTCVPCSDFYPELAAWQRDHAGTFTVALIASGDLEANRARSAEHTLANYFVEEDDEVSSRYRSLGTPAAVLINPDGTIASPLALGAEEIQLLTTPLRG